MSVGSRSATCLANMLSRGYHKFKCEKIISKQDDSYVKRNFNGVCFMKNVDLKPSKLPKRPFKNCGNTYFVVLAVIINMIFASNFTPIISHNQMNLLLN